MNNKKYFNIVLDYSIKKGIISNEAKNNITENYAPKEENAQLFKFKNAIFCAYCDDVIELHEQEILLYLLDFKNFIV